MSSIEPIEKVEIEKESGFNKVDMNRKFRLLASKMNEIIDVVNMILEPDSQDDDDLITDTDELEDMSDVEDIKPIPKKK